MAWAPDSGPLYSPVAHHDGWLGISPDVGQSARRLTLDGGVHVGSSLHGEPRAWPSSARPFAQMSEEDGPGTESMARSSHRVGHRILHLHHHRVQPVGGVDEVVSQHLYFATDQ